MGGVLSGLALYLNNQVVSLWELCDEKLEIKSIYESQVILLSHRFLYFLSEKTWAA
jgi:hypothetical protein